MVEFLLFVQDKLDYFITDILELLIATLITMKFLVLTLLTLYFLPLTETASKGNYSSIVFIYVHVRMAVFIDLLKNIECISI